MNPEAKHQNQPNQEGLFGWFPDTLADTPNPDPKNVYIYLGSRPPRERSFHEAKLIQDYYQRQATERFQKTLITPDEAITPPYAIEYNIYKRPKTVAASRSKSAFSIKNIPSTRIVLNIPKPNLNSFFNIDQNDSTTNNSNNISNSNAIKGSLSRPQTAASTIEILDDNQMDDGANLPIDKDDHENSNKENQSDLEQSNKPIIASNFGKKSLINDEINILVNEENDQNKCFFNKRPKTSVITKVSKHKEVDYKKRPHSSYIAKNINQVSGSLVDVSKNSKEPNKVIYNTNKVTINEDNQDLGVFGKKYAHKARKETPCCTLKEGYWKYDLLNRGDFIQERPKYFVPIDMESIKPDPERPKIHYNANETFFYNTLPPRKATFTVNQNFISENLRIPKKNTYDEKIRILNSMGKPVRFRRDYAFVY